MNVSSTKRVSLSFEASKPGTDFSSPAMRVLGGSTSNARRFCLHGRSVVQCSRAMNYLLWISWIACCSFYVSDCCFTLHLNPSPCPAPPAACLLDASRAAQPPAIPSPPPALGPQPRPLDGSPPGWRRPGCLCEVCEVPPCSLSSCRTTSPPQSLRLRGAHRPAGTKGDAA